MKIAIDLVNLDKKLQTMSMMSGLIRPSGKSIRDKYSRGKNILNTFSYTGAFSMAAAKGGAITTSVDLASRSLEKTTENFTINNIDPAKNTLINIASNQTNIRETFATSLKNSVLQLASYYKQPTLNPNGYDLLQMQSYAAGIPAIDSNTVFRINGAGDYRRAVGFADTTATCNGSIYPCKQGITGVNIINPNLPSIAYLVGHYADAASGCQLNIRANGVLELTKGTQVFRSTLDADSTDNLLQVDKATHLYLLNSSTTEPDNAALEYTFVQVNIKANQVLGASAGVDTRKAPDQLKSTQLQCSFS